MAESPFPDPACFNAGTKILTLNSKFEDVYISINNLRPGDIVKTYMTGYRKILHIGWGTFTNTPTRFQSCMYVLPKQGDMIDDLTVTGCHCVLMDKDAAEAARENHLAVYDKALVAACESKKFTKIMTTATYTFYHFCVENDGDKARSYIVWANGQLAETTHEQQFDDKTKFEAIL